MLVLRLAAALAAFSCALWGQGFMLPAGCTLPFEPIKSTDLDIDKSCTVDGNAKDTGKKLESNAKNNFCVTSKPVPITYTTFTRLQTASDNIDGLRNTLKTDRSVLSNVVKLSTGSSVGEGTLVQFVAYLLDAHVSNVRNGELVNCGHKGKDWNDIHIELVKTATEDDACNSVAVEMSPHFRPDTWDDLAGEHVKRPIRVTGPLFYDGSHVPCKGGKRPNPQRISVWEIHPVYRFDICKSTSLAACSAKNESAWIPFDQWHNQAATEDESEH